jgi:O-acetylhomoserine (thiol)-lyase
MAALGAVFQTLLKRGDHLVSSHFLFGNTNSQLQTLEALGLEVSFVDATDAAAVKAALRPETRMVLVETIANPATQIADLVKIGELCRDRKIIYVVDNTLTTGYLLQTSQVHADLAINSLSKYFGGHGDALGGCITDLGSFDWTSYPHIYDYYKGGDSKKWALTQIRKKGLRDFGGTLAPEAAHNLSVGSETLALRMDRACANAMQLALLLEHAPQIARVNYPGLPSHPQHALATRLFRRSGALLSFEVKAGIDPMAFLNALNLVIKSSNLGDSRTLAIPVAQTIFFEMGQKRRAEMGISEGLIRLSVGIEDPEDLIHDFESALAQFPA